LARARETNRFRAKTIAKTQQAGERCRLASRSEATQAAVRGKERKKEKKVGNCGRQKTLYACSVFAFRNTFQYLFCFCFFSPFPLFPFLSFFFPLFLICLKTFDALRYGLYVRMALLAGLLGKM
jgi:hypothetical protein